MRPTILSLRLGTVAGFYRWRLRRHAAQELLAGIGIAIGVALTFGVLVASTQIDGSAGEVERQLVGNARLQLAARSATGFSRQLARAAGELPGVRTAIPLLRSSATVVGPRGRQVVQLVGVSTGLMALGVPAARDFGALDGALRRGVALTEATARTVGAYAGRSVTLLTEGEAHALPVALTLGSRQVGAAAGSQLAIASLPAAQRLAGTPGRVSDVLIAPDPGATGRVRRELVRLAAGRLDVVGVGNELRLLADAARPTNQSTTLFAAISTMVGFLLALNAMLLSVPERRRLVADLRINGYLPAQIIAILAAQALTLGIVASLVGIAAGDALARTVLRGVPSFITFAFPLGSQQVVSVGTVLLALACGVAAALAASLPPMLDLRPGRSLDAALREPGATGRPVSTHTMRWLGTGGTVLLALATAIVLLLPRLTVLAGVLLALAAACLVPHIFTLIQRAIVPFSERLHRSMLGLAVLELRAGATRSVALAGVAALAVYGSVAIGGTRHDLLQGLDQAIVQEWGTAQVWVSPSENIFDTEPFRPRVSLAALARTPGVAAIYAHQAGFLDDGTRRLWVRAIPLNNPTMILSSQLLQGNLADANALLRRGGAAAISSDFAGEHHLHVGSSFTLPTPTGWVRFAVAAITTNLGWPAGTITIDTRDYDRYWDTSAPTAIGVALRSTVSPAAGRALVARALGDPPGLRVQTARQRTAEVEGVVAQGLHSLGEIATLLLVAAALAIAAALGAALWQRRGRFAALKASGYRELQLWRSLLLESAIVLGIGCIDGLVLGLYGHAAASRWLRIATGYPAPFSLGLSGMLLTLALVCGIALAVVALPGWSAAGVSPLVGFQE
jgi:putative ABC transport system permease protein